jgi:hypothetical protein
MAGQYMPMKATGQTVQPTRFLGGIQRPHFRASAASRAVREVLHDIGANPLAKLAVVAIYANNRGNLARDVSMKAKGKTKAQLELESMMQELDEKNAKLADASEASTETMKQVPSEPAPKLVDMKNAVVNKARTLAGISAPFDANAYSLGYFDPIGLSLRIRSVGTLLFWREVEIKHSRVAMLATVGIAVGERFHPLFGGDIDVPAYLAFQETPLQVFWPAVVAAIAIPELASISTFEAPTSPGNLWKVRADRVPGDLGFDPLGLKPTSPSELKELQTKELNNGRLAMIAAAGMIAQELVSGKNLFEDNVVDSLLSTGNVR